MCAFHTLRPQSVVVLGSSWDAGLVKSLLLIAAATVISVHASPGAAQPAPPMTKVGVMHDPCRALPPQPAAGTADDKRQIELRLADFFNLCRYRAANQALPPSSSTRIIFMGDSITEGWKESRPAFFQGRMAPLPGWISFGASHLG